MLGPGEYIQKHRHVLQRMGIASSEVFNAKFLDGYGYDLTFDRQLSLEKARSAGFLEEINPDSSWVKVFDRIKRAGMIPTFKRIIK
jgi:hypothetical protein